jgi:site-specific DNA recombinase
MAPEVSRISMLELDDTPIALVNVKPAADLTPTIHGNGIQRVEGRARSSADVLRSADLDWGPQIVPLFAAGAQVSDKVARAVIRDDTQATIVPRSRNEPVPSLHAPRFRANPREIRRVSGETAVGYVRASTDEQLLGPDAQRAALERWAAAKGVRLVSVHVDHGVSGGAPLEDCPGLLAAMEAVRTSRAGVLVVAKRDRLARDVMKAGMVEALLRRHGARVVSAAGEGEGEGPADALMRTIVDAFAQYERALIGARTKAGMAVKRTRGERVGSVPLGFELGADGVHLVPNAAEAAAVARARELHALGLTLAAVAEQLGADGHRPRRGERWYPAQVARMVRER